jgi:hypothetical protein
VLQADPADYAGARMQILAEPWELAADGCPGAWYRTELVEELAGFRRRRTDAGDRVVNPRFDGASWLVQDAIAYYEHEHEQARAYLLDAIDRINEATRKSRDTARNLPSRPNASARPGRARR